MTNETDPQTEPVTASVETEAVATATPVDEASTKREDCSAKETILEKLRLAVEKEAAQARDEVDILKQAYYKLRKTEAERISDPSVQTDAVADDLDREVKELLTRFKEKRTKYLQELEAQREANLAQKRAILAEIRSLEEDPDTVNQQYPRFQELQQLFKEVKEIPAQYVSDLWRDYQMAVENFYDLLKINKELRDYDFKKNQEAKVALCEAAEGLVAESGSIVESFKSLQKLHEEWRQIGPVAKELREELWNRFKEASTVINKRHQEYFEQRKGTEQENEARKTALCESVEALLAESFASFNAWEEATQKIIALQGAWKEVGFAARKINTQLYERFRKDCDMFFAKKAEYFKVAKEEMVRNLEMKRMLCEKAEALKDSTEWKHTTDYLVALQKEWKSVGPVSKKYSDAIWKRFVTACDCFFERKEKEGQSKRSEEKQNLASKEAILAQLESLESDLPEEEARQRVKQLMAEWSAVGHVPFKEKDTLYKRYQAALDKLFERLQMHQKSRRINNYSNSVRQMASSDQPQNALLVERRRLLRQYEQIKQELQTYQNNMGFLTLSSKGGSSLLKDLERKMQKLQSDMSLVEEKITLIDAQLDAEK